MDFRHYISKQREWSLEIFGKGKRTEGICEHIKLELKEISDAKSDLEKLEECIDVIILTMDMMWRLGFSPEQIENALFAKQEKNLRRKWPPREISEANQDKPTLHIKERVSL